MQQPTELRDIIKSEYKKCLEDPIYFARKYCWIQHPSRGRIRFDLWQFQEKVLKHFTLHKYIIILKSRQLGISTLTAAYALWMALFHNDKNILVVATRQGTAKNLITKVRVMYENLNSWLKKQEDTEEYNKLSIRFANGSQIKAESSTVNVGRSESNSLVIVDEAAFIQKFDEKWAALQQTAQDGNIIVLSTPNGMGNFFHKTWMDAQTGENMFFPIKLHWTVHPERDQKWRDEQDKLLGERKAAQECLTGDSIVTIKDKITDRIEDIELQEINKKQKILTPYGFKDFSGIRKINKDKYLQIVLENGRSIKCSEDHRFVVDNKQIFASDLQKADELDTKYGKKIIFDIFRINKDITLYDVLNVENNIFYGNDIVNHNCDTDFLSSGNTVINPEILKYYEDEHIREPIGKEGVDGNYWIWEYPDHRRSYIVSADVARGDANDYSAFHVIDIENLRQVAEYKGKPGTQDYGHMLVNVATSYNDALLVIENANIGWAAIQPAIDRQYKNLFYSLKQDSRIVDSENYLLKKHDLKNKHDMVPGFTTSLKTRPMIISKMELYLRQRLVEFYSQRLWDEFSVFIWLSSGKPSAQPGYNDDLVMSYAIGIWVRDTALKLKQEGMDLNRQTLTALGKSIVPPGLYTANEAKKHEQWIQQVGKEKMDLTQWL